MRGRVLLAVVGLAVMAPPAGSGPNFVEKNAKAAVEDTLGSLLTKKDGSAHVRIGKCKNESRANWHRCRVLVRGTDVCRLTVHVRIRLGEDGTTNYRAWGDRVRCR